MIVQRVVMPVSEAESWTVLREDGSLVEPVESYLSYLAALERSPNTQRAYATSLKLWFEFLDTVDIAWSEVTVDVVARFVSWLRAPAPNVVVLDRGTARRLPATVNRHLTAVFGFYEHQARTGVDVASGLVAWKRIGRGSYKPFLHHVTGGRPIATRPVKLPVPQRAPRTLTAEQLVQVLGAAVRARVRFLIALLAETGMRVGQALGLRHADFVSRAKQVRIVPRADNANGARAKLRSPATIPVTASLVRCYSDYMQRRRVSHRMDAGCERSRRWRFGPLPSHPYSQLRDPVSPDGAAIGTAVAPEPGVRPGRAAQVRRHRGVRRGTARPRPRATPVRDARRHGLEPDDDRLGRAGPGHAPTPSGRARRSRTPTSTSSATAATSRSGTCRRLQPSSSCPRPGAERTVPGVAHA